MKRVVSILALPLLLAACGNPEPDTTDVATDEEAVRQCKNPCSDGTTTVCCGHNQHCCVGQPFRVPTCLQGTTNICPISRLKYKEEVQYLDAREVERTRDELMKYKLATWRYKNQPASEPKHLGFIIDDVIPSPSVSASGETVDLYGYTSMAVATLQAQAKQIAALEKELQALKQQLQHRR